MKASTAIAALVGTALLFLLLNLAEQRGVLTRAPRSVPTQAQQQGPAPLIINIYLSAAPTPAPPPTPWPTPTLVPTTTPTPTAAPTPGPDGLTWQLHIGGDGLWWGLGVRNEATPERGE